MEKWKNINKLIQYSEGGILSKILTNTNKINVTLFCMGKDTEISEHTSTKEGFVYIIEGDGIFNLKDEEIPMKKDVVIFMEKNIVHSIKVKDNTSFILALANTKN